MLKNLYKFLCYALLITAFLVLFNDSVLAQDSTKDQILMVHEETAKIDMISQYVKTSKDWSAFMKQAGLAMNWYAYERNDLHFYYVTPLTNYAQIDSFQSIFQTAIDKGGKDKFSDIMASNNASINSTVDYIIRRSGELSYVPKKPRIELKDAGFVHWGFFHYKMDKRKEVMDILKEWKELYEKNNIPDAYGVYTMDLGRDNNEIVVFDYAKDASSYYKEDDEKSKEMKDAEQGLFIKISALLTSIETFTGRPRHDLDYIAK